MSVLSGHPSDGIVDRKFTCFPRLPAELRVKIWKYTWSESRIIEIELIRRGGWTRGEGWAPMDPNFVYHRYPGTSIPAALHVCQESREEALKLYEQLPSSMQYIDYSTDNIFLYCEDDSGALPDRVISEAESIKAFFGPSLQKIQHLVFSNEFFAWRHGNPVTPYQRMLVDLPKLKDVGIVLVDEKELSTEKDSGKRLVHRSRALVNPPPSFDDLDYPDLSSLGRASIDMETPEFRYLEILEGMEWFKYEIIDEITENDRLHTPNIYFLHAESSPSDMAMYKAVEVLGLSTRSKRSRPRNYEEWRGDD